MAAAKPEEMHQQFEDTMNRHDLAALLDLYEPGACLVASPGQPAYGREAIRQALKRLLDASPTIRCETRRVIEAGDIALLSCHWQMKLTGPDGSPAEVSGTSAEVARRQPDGSWRYIVDEPYGIG